MSTYLIIIGISTLLAYLPILIEEKTKNKKLVIIAKIVAILFPAIIAGIRYNVGTDYAGAYKPYFNEMFTGNHTYRMRKIEIGYELLNRIIILFGGSFNILMFVCSLIIDISCDKNGAIETSIPTTIDNPTYYVDGIMHYVVDHTPSLFYRTISKELSKEVCKYIDYIITSDKCEVLEKAQIIKQGNILDDRINKFQNRR